MEAVSGFRLGKEGGRERLPNGTQETGSLVRKRPRELQGLVQGAPGAGRQPASVRWQQAAAPGRAANGK